MKFVLRALLILLAAGALVVGTAVMVYQVDHLVSSRMGELRDRALAAFERAIGRRITYGSLSPSILQRIEVRDLAIHALDDPERVLLSVGNLQVRFSLIRLLRSRDPLEALTEVRIVNSRFRFEQARDRDIAELARDLLRSGGGDGLRVRLSGSGVDVEVVLPNATITGTGLSFALDGEAGQLAVSARGALAARLSQGLRLSTNLRAQGKLARDLTWSDVLLQVSSVSTSWLSAGRQTLQLSWMEPRLELRKIQDRQPVDLVVTVDAARGEVEGSLLAEGLRIDQLVKVEAGLLPDPRWLQVPFTGSAHATWRPGDGGLSYDAEISADLPDLLPVRDVRFNGKLHGDRERAYFHPLVATTPLGSIEFNGNLLLANLWPEGTLKISGFPLPTKGVMNTTVAIQRQEGSLTVASGRLELGDVALSSVEAKLEPLASSSLRFQVRASFARSPSEPAAMPASDLLQLDGELQYAGKRSLSLDAVLSDVPPDPLYQLALGAGSLPPELSGLEAFLAPLSLSASCTFWTDFQQFTLSSPQLRLSSKDAGGLRVSTALTLDRGNLTLSGVAGSWQGISFGGELSARGAGNGFLQFTADARVQGEPYSLSGTWSFREGLAAEGSNGLSLALIPMEGAWQLQAKADRLPVPLADRTWRPTFNLYGRVSSLDKWQLRGTVTLADLPLGRLEPSSIDLDLSVSPRQVEFAAIRFTDPFSVLEGRGSVSLDPAGPGLPMALLGSPSVTFSASVAARGSPEAYTMYGSYGAGALAAHVGLTSSPLSRLTAAGIPGAVSGSASFSGAASDPTIELDLALVDVKLGTDRIAGQIRCTLAHNRLEIADLSAQYLTHRLAGLAGYIDLDKADFKLAGRYQGQFFNDRVDLRMELAGTAVARDPADLVARFLDLPFSGRLSVDGVRVAGRAYPGWEARARTQDGKLYLDGGPDGALHGSIDRDLAFALTAQPPLPVQGRAEGMIKGDQIEASLDVWDLDLRIVNPILRSAVFTVSSGMAWGQVGLSGPLNDPDFSGELRVRDGGMTIRYSPDPVGPIAGRLTFDHKVLSSDPTTTFAGAARLAGKATFTFDHWIPASFTVDVATQANSQAHVAYRFGRAIVDGYASGHVSVSGDDRLVNVKGSAVANTCKVTLGPEETAPAEPEELPTFVEMTVVTGRHVDFYWPSDTLPVVRTTASTGGTIAITWRGDTGAYTVSGSTNVHGGDIYYFDRSFVLKSGTVTLNENEQAFDPRVKVHGEIRENDPRDGKEVKVYLDVDGPLSLFSPRFSSDPTLPQAEILALLGAPIMERIGGQGLLSSAVMLSGDFLSTFGLLRPFEQKVREALGLDVFSVRTQIIQNLLAQRLFGTASINPLDNTSLSLGKYLGDDLFLEMLVRLQAPRGPIGLHPARGLSTDLEVTLEWETPFFLMEWSFIPRHPETLFLTDNSLALSWRYSW